MKIKPNSKKGPLVQVEPTGEVIVFVREPAIEGKANTAAIKLLADYYNVPKRNVSIAVGHTSRIKIVDIEE